MQNKRVFNSHDPDSFKFRKQMYFLFNFDYILSTFLVNFVQEVIAHHFLICGVVVQQPDSKQMDKVNIDLMG
jgi:hypothetical protein